MGASVTPVLATPAEKSVAIFISHKHEDGEAAREIKTKLDEYGGDRLNVYVSELIPKGEQWEPTIHQMLKDSDWLLLLYTGPGVEWDWCLYETGFFAGTHDKSQTRLVCLHPKSVELPGPLNAWQAVTEDNCEELLQEIFRKPPYPGTKPLNPKVTDETLQRMARDIMDFTGTPKPTVFPAYIELRLDDSQQEYLVASGALDPDIPVAAGVKAREIFGISDIVQGESIGWAQIAGALERTRQKSWARGLSDSLRRVCRRESVSTTFPIVYSVQDETRRRWRPILYSAQHLGGAEVFRIIFSEILPEDDPRPSDRCLDHCTVLMTMSRMIRFGLIEKYWPLVRQFQLKKKMGEPASSEEIDERFGSLPAAIARIETEALNSGLQTVDSVLELFADDQQEECKKLEAWTDQWLGLRKRVAASVAARNLDELQTILDELRTLNRDSFRLIAHRYSQLIDELK
jgi:hypothetical protein